jgi:ABC-type enterochelin transport system substrate-binding protein
MRTITIIVTGVALALVACDNDSDYNNTSTTVTNSDDGSTVTNCEDNGEVKHCNSAPEN